MKSNEPTILTLEDIDNLLPGKSTSPPDAGRYTDVLDERIKEVKVIEGAYWYSRTITLTPEMKNALDGGLKVWLEFCAQEGERYKWQ